MEECVVSKALQDIALNETVGGDRNSRESKIDFPQGLSNGRKDETLTGAGTEY